MLRFARHALVLVLAAAPAARAADVDPLLPPDTEQIMHVNVRQILESEIIKKFALGQVKQALGGEDAQKMLKEFGLDPMKDIDRATVAIWGKTTDPSTLAIIRGTFDAEKLFAGAEKAAKDMGDKVSIVEEGDYKLVKIVGDNGKPNYAAVADNKTVLLGSDKKIVAAGLAAAVKKVKPTLNKELAALLLKQDEKASMFFCGVTEGKLKDIGDLNVPIPGIDGGKIKDGLQKMNSVSVTIRLAKEVALDISMGMKDADAADDFGTTLSESIKSIKGLLPLVGMQQPKADDLIKDVTDSLKSKAKDKDVTVSVKVSGEAIAKMTGAAN